MKRINFVENNLLYALATELQATLAGAKLISIHRLLTDGLAFKLAEDRWLVISLNPAYPAIYAGEQPPLADNAKATAYDAHLKGARLVSIAQINHDRLIAVRWEVINPVLGSSFVTLFCEFLGSFCNLVLVGANQKILAFEKAQGPDENQRLIARDAVYHVPSASTLPDFTTVSADVFRGLFDIADPRPVWKFLVMRLSRLSPQNAQEILARAGFAVDLKVEALQAGDVDRLWQELQTIQALCRPSASSGCFLYRDRETHVPACLSLYPAISLAACEETSYPSVNRAIAYSHTFVSGHVSFETEKNDVLRTLKKRVEKATALRKQLQKDIENVEKADTYRLWGELIKSNHRNLSRGKSEVTVTNFYDPTNATITIALDPTLDLHVNADRYFKKARKAEAGEDIIRRRIRQNNTELFQLHRLYEAAAACQTPQELYVVRQQAKLTFKPAAQDHSRPKQEGRAFFRVFTIVDGWKVLTGRNDKENDLLTHRTAALDDLWFHARDLRGSHVVLRREGRKSDITPTAIEQAAAIAAWYSKARNSGKVAVDYMEVRYLRKPKGAPPGLVTYTQHQTVTVAPGLPEKPAKSSAEDMEDTEIVSFYE